MTTITMVTVTFTLSNSNGIGQDKCNTGAKVNRSRDKIRQMEMNKKCLRIILIINIYIINTDKISFLLICN